MHLVLCLEGLPLLPLDLGPARGVGVSLGVRLGTGGLAPVSPSPSGVGGAGVARSLQTPISRVSDVVDSPQFSPHVPQRGNSRVIGILLPRFILPQFPIFGSRIEEG